MPLYIIERAFAEQLDLTTDDVRLLEDINADEGIRWVFSFLSADRRHTYCLYEAPFAEAIMAAAGVRISLLTPSSRSKHRHSESRAARSPGPQRNLTHNQRKPAARCHAPGQLRRSSGLSLDRANTGRGRTRLTHLRSASWSRRWRTRTPGSALDNLVTVPFEELELRWSHRTDWVDGMEA